MPGLSDLVEVRVGRALDTLPKLAAENRGPFDLIFIGTQISPVTRITSSGTLKLSRPGSLIIADNVVRDGAVSIPPAAIR